MDRILNEIKQNGEQILKITLSDTKSEIKKIVIRKVEIKNKSMWQIEKFIGAQVFHENIDRLEEISINFSDYNQILFTEIGENKTFFKAKNGYKIKTNFNEIKSIQTSHNKQKNYIINEGDNVPALVDLGVFSKDGKIIKDRYDKFKQINKFIEIINDSFKNLNQQEITILDFGCGKSYLTFLVYYYFVEIKKIKATIIGYDLKADVVENCNKIAQKYGYKNLKFYVSDVKKDELFKGKIDMIITLHACNTATDYALNFAINNQVKNIFSVPCCQHEINQTIKTGGDFDVLLTDGLIKERFSALLTDAFRVEMLRAKGYSVDVIEFVDFAHSPKNLMIRAKLNSTKKSISHLTKLKEKYQFSQTLYELQNGKTQQ